MKKPMHAGIPKSKSSTHLIAARQPRPGTTTPGGTKLRRGVTREDLSLSALSSKDRNDSDWLLRAGATISSSTRESKGQAWLVSRASSTNLSGQQDEDEEALQRELAREREQASRRGSRRGSTSITFDADDEFSPITTRRSLSFGPGSGPGSRFGSRPNSRRGSRAQVFTPAVGEESEGYFNQKHMNQEGLSTEPDFVDAENEDEVEIKDSEDENNDEAVVRKLARANSLGIGGWVEKMLGWSLFAVDEEGEETEIEIQEEIDGESTTSSRIARRVDEVQEIPDSVPPPHDENAGGWQDAAWLLSVAAKVIL